VRYTRGVGDGCGCILVVDDDEDILDVVGALLSEQGYQVRCAVNGAGALAEVARAAPDLILLDVRMPTMDGWDFCRRLPEVGGRAVPVVVMSADPHAEARARAEGVAGFLQKPFELKALFVQVRAALAAAAVSASSSREAP
jgi:two-component system sensor histidine kinase/response regulator